MTRRELTPSEQSAAENLRRVWARKKSALALTQEKAAHAAGWASQGAFSQYLLGRIPLNVDAVLRLAAVLQVHPTEIDPSVEDLLPERSSKLAFSVRFSADEVERLSLAASRLGKTPEALVNDIVHEHIKALMALENSENPATSIRAAHEILRHSSELNSDDLDRLQRIVQALATK